MYLLLFAALFLQLALSEHIKIIGSKPDLLLILVVFLGLFFGSGTGLEAGLVAGFLKDIYALDFFGINTFIIGLTGLVAGAINGKFFIESKATQFLAAFFFTAVSMTLHFMLVSALSKSLALSFSEYAAVSIVPTSLYTSLVAIPIFSKFIDMYNLKESEEFL